MSLDERLRATMAAHGASLTPTYDPVDSVVVGAWHRRRALIVRMLVALAVIAGLAAAVPLIGAGRGSIEPAGVPWLDQPVDLGPPGPACDPAELELTEGRGDRVEQYILTVRNTSARTCAVAGRPVIEAGGVTVPTSEPADIPAYVQAPSVALGPGESTFAKIGLPADCVPNGWPTYFDDVDAVFAGRSVHLDDRITSGCGLLASDFANRLGGTELFHLVRPPSPAVAEVRAPTKVRAGRVLDFKVLLRNIDVTPLALDPLVYYMSFAADARGYRLNSGGITIPAGGTQWFDMRIRVPAGTPAGSYALTWWLAGRMAPKVVAVDVQP